MNRSWWSRFILLSVLTVVAVLSLAPTVMNFNENSSFPIKSKINLGLDLQGGLYMVLGIDFKKVYRDEVKNNLVKMVKDLKEEEINAQVGQLHLTNDEDPDQELRILDPALVDQAKQTIKTRFGYVVRLIGEEAGVLRYGLGTQYKNDIEENAIKKSIEVIRNRIDEFGVTEPEIVSLGSDRIVVQLPGVKDIERAKELIGKTAKLEFKLIDETVAPSKLLDVMDKAKEQGIEYKRGNRFSEYVAKMNSFMGKDLPNGSELVFKKVLNKNTSDVEQLIPYLVQSATGLTGDLLQDAVVRIDQQNNQPYVGITFKSRGGALFEEITGENVGKRLAIILDGNIYSDPVIQARIAGGNAQITLGSGNYNDLLTEARDLALVLRAGALPVELEFQEQRVVGPSLGADSIRQSKNAGLIGSFLVFLFVLVYYKFSGVLAIKTLILNIIFIMACLVGLEATLTLPGIAGIALTVGMAIDGNIIIFERIKEELRLGTPIREAVETGFSRAFWTILDANLTTAVAGLMLLNFGTGPIRGFAVTLLVGIMCTVYTSYFVGRVMFEFYIQKTHGKQLSI